MTNECAEVEFFGARIKCRNPRLAALLNSDVTEDVVVVGKRAVDLVVVDGGAEEEAEGLAAAEDADPLQALEAEEA